MKVGLVGAASDIGNPVLVARVAYNTPKILMKQLGKESLSLHLALQSEVIYRLCASRTREHGKLVKMISIGDANKITILKLFRTRGFGEIVALNSKRSEFLHPQLLGSYVIANLPFGTGGIVNFIKRKFAKKIMSRISFCNQMKPGGDLANSKPAKKYELEDVLPSFLGGTANCPTVLQAEGEAPPAEEIEQGEEEEANRFAAEVSN